MKRFFFMVLAVTMLAVPMAGCSGDDKSSCKDACKKLDSCGIINGQVDTCTAACEQDATQDEIDCVMDASCGNVLDRC